MKRSRPRLLYLSFFLLALTLFGFGRLLPLPARASPAIPQSLTGIIAGASATETREVRPTLAVTPLISIPTEASKSTLFAFIEAPQGAVSIPYVTITGFQSGTFSSAITINGTLNTTEFICGGTPCTVPLQLGESRVGYYARTPAGLTSDTAYAVVLVILEPDGYHVTISSVSEFATTFFDACQGLWDVPNTTDPSWAEFPLYPYQLNTRIPLHHLASRLILFGLVDARDCPAGGMSQDMEWPNACGIERTTSLMTQWQNLYDDAIWTAARQIGIPPKILKTLIEVESQFWPGNERFFLDEYGLGQVNQLGVDVLLRNDPALYQQICSTILSNCFVPYMSLAAHEQALVRGALLASQNTSCDTCPLGVDLVKAKQSITFIAQVLRANCQQAKDILGPEAIQRDYESDWKFTLLSYHSGQNCLSTAVQNTRQAGDDLDWEHVSEQITCPGGKQYVDGLWSQLSLFDSYRYSSGAEPIVQFTPVFAPTHTPLPTPTTIISQAQVVVNVFIDSNGDGRAQASEGLNGIPVQLEFTNGPILSGVTSSGQATFDLSGYAAGLQINATLPNLYSSHRFYLPQSGVVQIDFGFAQPTLPGKLP